MSDSKETLQGLWEFKGDQLGFTFNGIHSSVLGIVRTQSGLSKMALAPEGRSKTKRLQGRDEEFYYNTTYTKKSLTIDFAFYKLSDIQIRNMQSLFNDRQIHDLIFDEEPHKVYSAKVTGVASIKHLCFEENDEVRYYNGEGNIQFVCYFPFARSLYPYREDYSQEEFPSQTWLECSGLPSNQDFGIIERDGNNFSTSLYNPGDADAIFRIWIKTQELFKEKPMTLTITSRNTINGENTFKINDWINTKTEECEGLCIDLYNMYVVGAVNVNNKKVDNILYTANTEGEYFQLPANQITYLDFALETEETSLDNFEIKLDVVYLYNM